MSVMRPFIIYFDNTQRNCHYMVTALNLAGFEVYHTDSKEDARDIAQARGKEAVALILNFNQLYDEIPRHELTDEGLHPLVHLHTIMRSMCNPHIPSFILTKFENATVKSFRITGDTSKLYLICLHNDQPFGHVAFFKQIIEKSIKQLTAT